MKKLILLILLIPSLCFGAEPLEIAWMNVPTIAGAGVAAGACSTIMKENTNAESSTWYGDGYYFIGQWALPLDAGCVCKVQFTATLKNGVNYKAGIWTYNTSTYALETQQGSYSDNTVTGDGTKKAWNFTFSTCVNLSAGNYAITISRADNAVMDFYTSQAADDNEWTGNGYWGAWNADKTNADFATNDSIMKVYK